MIWAELCIQVVFKYQYPRNLSVKFIRFFRVKYSSFLSGRYVPLYPNFGSSGKNRVKGPLVKYIDSLNYSPPPPIHVLLQGLVCLVIPFVVLNVLPSRVSQILFHRRYLLRRIV